MVKRGIEIRIYPNREQEKQLAQWFGNQRFVWNQMLGMMNQRYKNNPESKFLNNYNLNILLPQLKEEYPFLKESESSSLQTVNDSLNQAFLRLFEKKAGHPKFKSKKKAKKSVTIKNNQNIELTHNAIKIPKLGWIKARWKCNFSFSKIKRITVTKTSSHKYMVSVLVECEKQAKAKTDRKIGIDVGQRQLLTTSDGEVIPSLDVGPLEKELVKWQKIQSRRRRLAKEKGIPLYEAKNYQKASKKVASIHEKIRHKRKNFLHHVSHKLVSSYDYVAMEDIPVKKLLQKKKKHRHKNNHKLSHQGWGLLKIFLAYKLEESGKEFKLVDPAYTSQDCSACGYRFSELTLEILEWTCPHCQTHHDRDVNAAINILNKSLIA